MKRKYGFDWPTDPPDAMIDLHLAKHWREEPYASGGNRLGPEEHLLRAIRQLFTPEQCRVHRWMEEHAYDWTHSTFCITWGCGASGKSNDYGLFCVLDWIVDPRDTISILASTTAQMLQLRSFESAQRYFRILKAHPRYAIPGKESVTRLAILNDEDEERQARRGGVDEDSIGPSATVKASIKGVAVQKGTVEEARANLQGAHLPYVRLILDEMSQMREAAVQARTNLRLGARDFRFFGLCNPDSIYDLACRHSVPVNGWASVDPETSTYWETQWGQVRRHDGLQSPAIVEAGGAEKYPFLTKQKDVDDILREHGGNKDHPMVWTQLRGWPPRIGTGRTVLDEATVVTCNMAEPVAWRDPAGGFKVLAGFDPAFSAGGDDPILQIAYLGHSREGIMTLAFGPTLLLSISASDPRPVAQQLLSQVLKAQGDYGFPWSLLGVDDSGTQSVADILDMASGASCFRVNFASKASDLPVSMVNAHPSHTVYRNRVTELYGTLVELARNQQIRQAPAAALQQMVQRRYVEESRPLRLEDKREAKKRAKRSPDHADACAIVVGVARDVLGLVPGSTVANPSGARVVTGEGTGAWASVARKFNNLRRP